MLACRPCSYLVDREGDFWGRRNLLLLSGCWLFVGQVIVAVGVYRRDSLALFGLCFYQAGFSMGYGAPSLEKERTLTDSLPSTCTCLLGRAVTCRAVRRSRTECC